MKEKLSIMMVIILAVLLLIVVGSMAVFYFKKKRIKDRLDHWLTAAQPYFLLTFILLFIASVLFFTLYFSKDFLPYPVSDHGQAIVPLFNTTTVLTGIAFFLTQLLLFFFAYRYRTKPGRNARFLKGFIKLELFWIIVPALTFIFLFIWGQVLWAKIQSEPEGEVLEVEVMGEQFSWWVRYPGKDHQLGKFDIRLIDQVNDMGIDFSDPASQDDIIPVQMHIPKDRPVRILLRSRDVIHSFFIPHMRVKMDALPGMRTQIHFTATTTTEEMREKLNNPDFNYEIACAELCGRMHFAMKLILVVEEPAQFEKWYRAQQSWLSKHPAYAQKISHQQKVLSYE